MNLTDRKPAGLLLVLSWLLLAPQAVAEESAASQPPPQDEFAEFGSGSSAAADNDPWERWNRQVFSFNETVDDWVLRPVASGYRKVTPGFVRRGVGNVFSNLGELENFTNSVFQLKLESAVVAVGRFTFNTVFGLGGIFDVATAFDLPERPEDFGQTLGYWGVGSGPYLMLPFLGPSNPRDLTGFTADTLMLPSPYREIETPDRYYVSGFQVIHIRSELIPAEQFMTGDRYRFVRNAYMQRRDFLINDGRTTTDPFAEGDDDLMLDDF